VVGICNCAGTGNLWIEKINELMKIKIKRMATDVPGAPSSLAPRHLSFIAPSSTIYHMIHRGWITLVKLGWAGDTCGQCDDFKL
jgi:hypothetical protein